MFIRPCCRRKNGKRHAYWALVESYRTAKGPRQRVVGYLGDFPEKARGSVKRAVEDHRGNGNRSLFPETGDPGECAKVMVGAVRTENTRGFGGPWPGMQLVKALGLDDFLASALPRDEETVPWNLTALALVLCRLLNPSSEPHIAEHFCRSTALSEIPGIPAGQIYDRIQPALRRW